MEKINRVLTLYLSLIVRKHVRCIEVGRRDYIRMFCVLRS